MSDARGDWKSERLHYRAAEANDVPLLAPMNRQLIIDEGHSNPMSASELESRMRQWLETGEYEATLFLERESCVGYALWQRQEHCVYVRHFFIQPRRRREGLGREAMRWLCADLWRGNGRIRLDVLIDNPRGMAFWRALGFEDYCVTMQLELPFGFE